MLHLYVPLIPSMLVPDADESQTRLSATYTAYPWRVFVTRKKNMNIRVNASTGGLVMDTRHVLPVRAGVKSTMLRHQNCLLTGVQWLPLLAHPAFEALGTLLSSSTAVAQAAPHDNEHTEPRSTRHLSSSNTSLRGKGKKRTKSYQAS